MKIKNIVPILLIALCAIISSKSIIAQGIKSDSAIVFIEDASLRAAIKKELAITNDAEITVELMKSEKLKYIGGYSSQTENIENVTSLSGLEYATNLLELNIKSLNTNDLAPLTNLSNLKTLEIWSSNLDNTHIQKFIMNNNSLSITRLRVANAKLTNGIIEILQSSNSIKEVLIHNNHINDFSSLNEEKFDMFFAPNQLVYINDVELSKDQSTLEMNNIFIEHDGSLIDIRYNQYQDNYLYEYNKDEGKIVFNNLNQDVTKLSYSTNTMIPMRKQTKKGYILVGGQVKFNIKWVDKNAQLITIKIEYVDNKNKKLAKDMLITGEVGQKYKVSKKKIKGYQVQRIVGKEQGVFSKAGYTIKYIYEKNKQATNTIKETNNSIANTGSNFLLSSILGCLSIVALVVRRLEESNKPNGKDILK